jgi:hypothetical protein
LKDCKGHKLYQLAGTIVLVLLGVSYIHATERPLENLEVLRFDAGPNGSAIECQTIRLTLGSTYTPARGFGWTERPERDFDRRELSRSRSELTIDGVAGERFAFRADVAPGTWHVTVWLEAEPAKSHWPKVRVQGQSQKLHWQQFQSFAEPTTTFEKTYRVFQCVASVGTDGLSLELLGGQSQVNLLGVSLIRSVESTAPEHQSFLNRLEAAGDHRKSESLDELRRQAEAFLCKNPSDAVFAIWHQRLEQLIAAEKYYSMRGWQWANEETGLGMHDRQCQAVMLLDGLLTPELAEATPLAERALYFRGRMLYWLGKEHDGADEIAAGKRDLDALFAKHPEDELLAMYTGQQVAQLDDCGQLSPDAQAPDWSVAQREALCRMRRIAHWWVEQRQSTTGEFGGKIGDDVELLRWWAPLCLAGDRIALQGWKKLADSVWQSEHVIHGYARNVRDVEHAAEFVADTTPLMLLYSDDPIYEQRLAQSTKLFEKLWTGFTVNGNRFFRSAWFSATTVETDEHKGCDVEYNTRAAQGLRYLAWRRPNPDIVNLLHQWSKAWANAAMRTDKGKPQGIIPASVRFSDESFNGDGPNWYEANLPWDYYDWDFHAGSMMLDQLLFTYTLTKDEELLQPMFMALNLIRSHESAFSKDIVAKLKEGSPAWAAVQLAGVRLFWQVVEQYRFLSGDSRWDDLIMQHGTAYGRYRISQDERHLTDGFDVLLADLRYNTPLKTTEVLYTDRVRVANAEFLKAMLTGDGIQSNLSPYHAVSWQDTDDNFTALVTNASPTKLDIKLFSHGSEERKVQMRVWQLVPGSYRLISEPSGTHHNEPTIVISERGLRIPIILPSRETVRVTLEHLTQVP